MERKRHASSSPAIASTTSSPLPWAKKQPQISSPHPELSFLPSLVRMILPRSTGLQKSLLPAPWRNPHQPLLSTAKLQLLWWGMAWERAGETMEAGAGGAGSQRDLPGQRSMAALDPAAAKLPGKWGRLRGDKEAQDGHSAEDPDLQVLITSVLHCSAACCSCLTFISMVHEWSLAFYTVSQWAWYGRFCSISYSLCVSSYHWRVS